MDNIQELKRKHYNVKEVIKERVKNGKEVSDKVDEYLDICKQLRKAGVVVNDSSPRLLEALKQCGVCTTQESASPVPIKPEPTPIPIPVQPETYEYKITLAWTERPGQSPDKTVTIIENYLTENKAKFVDSTDADFDDYKEVMMTYEWEGTDKEFSILRRSANYILDVFAQNQYEKFNISIFGNKKK